MLKIRIAVKLYHRIGIIICIMLVLSYHSKITVSEDHYLGLYIMLYKGCKFTHGHLESAVSADSHGLTLGSRDLGTATVGRAHTASHGSTP